MQIVRNILNFDGQRFGNQSIVLSVGNFDGVHRGHQYLIQKNIQLARLRGWQSAVMTFSPHPIKFLNPEKPFEPLFDKEDCIEELGKLGLDFLILQNFDRRFSMMTADDFLSELFAHVPVKALVLGPDFCFGLNRSGNLEYLAKESHLRKFELEVPEVLKDDSLVISTSGIKKKLAVGDVEEVKKLLGRNFYLNGEVVKGDQRGRLLGFPTANILTHSAVHLLRGVYTSRVHLIVNGKPQILSAITNVGHHPTFQNSLPQVKIETHIFDFDSNIYGKIIKVELIEFLREEKKFAGKNELIQQIQVDIQQARSRF
jgi:riboflavin kinase/FMN adenylyltransferase